MTHEEEAEKVLDRAYDLIEPDDQLTTVTERGLLKAIADALASAEKKAYEKGREEGYRVKHMETCSFLKGWNEAIEAARKVAEDWHIHSIVDVPKGHEVYSYRKDIAESINKLKRG